MLGDRFVNWVHTLYTDTNSRLCTNGYLSDAFQLQRGVRQDCPLSPMLYTLVTETLLSTIRKTPEVKGYLGSGDREIKVKTYADDTVVFVTDVLDAHLSP